MRIFSARNAAKQFGELLEAADDAPVMIHRHGRPRAAVIGYGLYRRYKEAYDAAEDERMFDAIERSIDALADGKFGDGQRALALAKRLGFGGTKGAGA